MLSTIRIAAVAAALCSTVAGSGPAAAAGEGRALLRGEAEAYVQHVLPGSRDDAVARWRDPICPLVAGLPADQAEILLERLSSDALAVGAPLGASDCHANLFVVAAAEPKSAMRAWARREPVLFGAERQADLDRVIAKDRPVRVWLKVASAAADGHFATDQSQALFGTQGQSSRPVMNWTNPTHLAANTARYISGAAVVLGPGVQKVRIDQLADYIALTTFAQVNQDADVGPEASVLKLFGPGAASPAGLSTADAAYLRALYHVAPNGISQRTNIAARMAEDETR